MKELFLGKPLHWLLLVIIVGILAVVGQFHMHVSQFNQFVLILLVIGTALVAIVVIPHKHGEKITREELEPDDSM